MIIIYRDGEYYCKTCHEKDNNKSNGMIYPVINKLPSDLNPEGITQVIGMECKTCRSFMLLEKYK